MNSLIKRIEEIRGRRTEGGFSLIDVVVTVAIIVALSVGGFVAYSSLVSNAKQGAVDYAASNVYRSAVVYENDGDNLTNACSAIDEYNGNSEGIAVSLLVPANATQGPDDSPVYFGKADPRNTYNC
jgi:type II secretory pathway pseudopilin PulG